MTRTQLDEVLHTLPPLDDAAAALAQKRLDSIAKPLHSLGLLEEAVVQTARLTGSASFSLTPCELFCFCADNGVVAEGVTQSPQEVTALLTRNLVRGDTTVSHMAHTLGVTVVPVDMGLNCPERIAGTVDCRVANGTQNFAVAPAMTEPQLLAAMQAGMHLALDAKARGVRLLAVGELGIGNTTTSSAVAAALLRRPAVEMTGRGAGLSSQGLAKKIAVIDRAIERFDLGNADVLSVLQTVGGFDLAGMVGFFLGARMAKLPVLLDGFITAAAALAAVRLAPAASDALLASHVSAEPAGAMVLEALGKRAILTAGLCLGEGTGSMAALSVLTLMEEIYDSMSTFDDIHLEQYQPLR